MLYEKRLPYKIICILLFLFSLNIFNQSSLLLTATFILVVGVDRGCLYIPAKDNTFFALVVFSVAFFVFSAQNGVTTGISAMGCPMAYYLGARLGSEITDDVRQSEARLNTLTLVLVAGMTCHAVVNFIYELVRFGGINSGGIHYDFFSFGARTSATGAATYLTLFAGVIFYIVMASRKTWSRIAGLGLIVIAVAYDMVLGGRTFFALSGLATIASMLIFLFGQKNALEKLRAWRKIIFVSVILIVGAIFVYIRYRQEITKIFESTYLFHRISYAKISESQDLFTFFKSTDRGDVRKQYIDLMFNYPFGGRKMLGEVGFYAHELWLDIFDSAGIVPFILIWIITLQITVCNIKYIFNRGVPIQNRILIVGITTSVTVQFFFEPVLTGCRTLLFSYFVICGLVKNQKKRYY